MLRMNIAMGLLLTAALALPAQADTSLWVESPGTMILHDHPAGTTKEISLTGARNEYLSAQLGLRASQDIEKPFTFDWTALKGPGGKEIAKSNVMIFRAADISVDHISDESKCKDPLRSRATGMFPDALVPLVKRDGTNVCNSIKLNKDQTQAFWIDIFIPPGTAAGQYTGSITLQTDAKPITIPVKVDAVNVEIPADSTIPSAYNLRTFPHVATNMDAYVAEVMAHRIQPTSYNYIGMPQALADKYNPNGKGYVSMLLSDTSKPSASRAKEIVDTLNKISAHLKQRNLFDHTYLQLKDEPDTGQLQGIAEVAKVILAGAPDWKGKLMETTSSREGSEIDKLLNVEVSTLRLYGPWGWTKCDGREEWDKRRAAGQQLWFYVSNNQGTPYPTFDVDMNTVAFEPRVMAWGWWYEKAVGHLYWDLMYADPPEKPVQWKLSKEFPPGDGQLIYTGDFTAPGAPSWVLIKDLKGPVISRRLKIFRQGLQEWELLKMAEKKVGRAKVEAIASKVYTCLGTKEGTPSWSYKESAWDQASAEVLKLLE